MCSRGGWIKYVSDRGRQSRYVCNCGGVYGSGGLSIEYERRSG